MRIFLIKFRPSAFSNMFYHFSYFFKICLIPVFDSIRMYQVVHGSSMFFRFSIFPFCRHGHVVAFVLNRSQCCVGVVASLWQGLKKPRLSTTALSANHISTMRVIQAKAVGEHWECSDQSLAFLVRVEQILSILDSQQFEETTESLRIRLTPESEELLRILKGDSLAWWPGPDKDVIESEAWHFSAKPVSRKRKFDFAMRCSAKSKTKLLKKEEGQTIAADVADTEEAKKSKKAKKTKKGKGKKHGSKPVEAAKEIEFQPENFRKNETGRQLVQQTVRRIRNLDAAHFPSKPVFDSKDQCLLVESGVHGVTWAFVLSHAYEFLCKEFPGGIYYTCFALYFYVFFKFLYIFCCRLAPIGNTCRFASSSSIAVWGKQVWRSFQNIIEDLENGRRRRWLTFIKNVCQATA